jgi:hypothetical protein
MLEALPGRPTIPFVVDLRVCRANMPAIIKYANGADALVAQFIKEQQISAWHSLEAQNSIFMDLCVRVYPSQIQAKIVSALRVVGEGFDVPAVYRSAFTEYKTWVVDTITERFGFTGIAAMPIFLLQWSKSPPESYSDTNGVSHRIEDFFTRKVLETPAKYTNVHECDAKLSDLKLDLAASHDKCDDRVKSFTTRVEFLEDELLAMTSQVEAMTNVGDPAAELLKLKIEYTKLMQRYQALFDAKKLIADVDDGILPATPAILDKIETKTNEADPVTLPGDMTTLQKKLASAEERLQKMETINSQLVGVYHTFTVATDLPGRINEVKAALVKITQVRDAYLGKPNVMSTDLVGFNKRIDSLRYLRDQLEADLATIDAAGKAPTTPSTSVVTPSEAKTLMYTLLSHAAGTMFTKKDAVISQINKCSLDDPGAVAECVRSTIEIESMFDTINVVIAYVRQDKNAADAIEMERLRDLLPSRDKLKAINSVITNGDKAALLSAKTTLDGWHNNVKALYTLILHNTNGTIAGNTMIEAHEKRIDDAVKGLTLLLTPLPSPSIPSSSPPAINDGNRLDHLASVEDTISGISGALSMYYTSFSDMIPVAVDRTLRLEMLQYRGCHITGKCGGISPAELRTKIVDRLARAAKVVVATRRQCTYNQKWIRPSERLSSDILLSDISNTGMVQVKRAAMDCQERVNVYDGERYANGGNIDILRDMILQIK